MSRNAFGKLCLLLQSQGGLRDTKHVSVRVFGSSGWDIHRCSCAIEDRARYRTRKGSMSVNVLGVCDRKMRFIYVLASWEGSVADGRVLRDAFSRPNGLKIPRDEGLGDEDIGEYLGTVDSNPIWNTWRDEMASRCTTSGVAYLDLSFLCFMFQVV
ncbi:UNVERIFIED_CONTAM: hypothetical protein Sradi_3813000 [Sesamum radiatum]|uniref:DDE Tnp4 domain-containing protein n=1 Tax=Sesamum radiatum TaxID=300843 RepID=A0AAW2Q0Q6_SESRA